MEVVQVRLPEKIVEVIDEMVAQGFYSSRSDFIRTKIRKTLEEQSQNGNGLPPAKPISPKSQKTAIQIPEK
jgi:Arc/MetJ-type ribon-helix-helix transcriptional regulator